MHSDCFHKPNGQMDNGQAAATVLDRAAPSPNGRRSAGGSPARTANRAGDPPAPRETPSPIGGNGDPTLGREANGRFTKGNAGGPGNPFARQVAALRQALLDEVTPDDIRAILRKMKQLAQEGDVAAAKVVLAYTVGKPAPATQPDHLDEDEWQRFKAQAPMMEEMPALVATPTPIMPLMAVRAARPGIAEAHGSLFGGLMGMPLADAYSALDRLDELPPDKMAAELRKVAKSMPGNAPSTNRPNGGKRGRG